MFLVRHELTTGVISGLWEANDPAMLALQIVQGDPVYGYLVVDDPMLTATEIQEDWMVQGGALVPKPPP
jgi:hypothetical protein